MEEDYFDSCVKFVVLDCRKFNDTYIVLFEFPYNEDVLKENYRALSEMDQMMSVYEKQLNKIVQLKKVYELFYRLCPRKFVDFRKKLFSNNLNDKQIAKVLALNDVSEIGT